MNDRPHAPELNPDFACVPANPSWRMPVTFDKNGNPSAELTALLS